MNLHVISPGPLTSVQDAGRTGYAAKGYRVCGAADSYAYRLGNMLIGNAPGAAVLECTLRGAALRPHPGIVHRPFPRVSMGFSTPLRCGEPCGHPAGAACGKAGGLSRNFWA